MKVKVIKLADAIARDIKFYENTWEEVDKGVWQWKMTQKSFNEEVLNEDAIQWYKDEFKELWIPDDHNHTGPIVISPNPEESTPMHIEPNPNKTYIAVFIHKHNDTKPDSAWDFTQCYRDKYYCRVGGTIMYYPAEMIYSRGKEWVVESPEYFKVSKEITAEAFLIDLE